MTVSLSIDRFFQREFGKNFGDTELGKIVRRLPFFMAHNRHSAIDGGPWIAGGALRRAMMGEPLGGDIDIFFRHKGQLDAFVAGLQRVSVGHVGVDETDSRRIKVFLPDIRIGLKLDLVRGVFFENTYQLLNDFDFTCCCVATDGTTLWMDDYALFDNARKLLRANNLDKLPCSLEHMIRYMRMGFVADDQCLSKLLSYGQQERDKARYEYSGPDTVVEENNHGEPDQFAID